MSLLSRFISGHKFLTLLSGIRNFRKLKRLEMVIHKRLGMVIHKRLGMVIHAKITKKK